MNAGATPAAPFDFDEPRRRLVWIVPLAVVLWAAVLLAFARLLERTAPPPPEFSAVQARIIELPPAGLQGGTAAPAPARVIAKPKPIEHPHPRVHHRALPKPIVPLAPPSIAGTAKSVEAPPAAAAGAVHSTERTGVSGGFGSGSGAGLGSDNAGARAIYAPTPEIPDDLREETFNAVAVAHFKVAADGTVEVTLTKATENPSLNAILLNTLKQWRFFPAMRNGVAVNAEFDLRIPISVR
ncbi:MAG TPA: energy transducer TonB [Candidatus Binataceae bacterium]|nr:energy transducer TonB [Candidatus Binataceae bacterium]